MKKKLKRVKGKIKGIVEINGSTFKINQQIVGLVHSNKNYYDAVLKKDKQKSKNGKDC